MPMNPQRDDTLLIKMYDQLIAQDENVPPPLPGGDRNPYEIGDEANKFGEKYMAEHFGNREAEYKATFQSNGRNVKAEMPKKTRNDVAYDLLKFKIRQAEHAMGMEKKQLEAIENQKLKDSQDRQEEKMNRYNVEKKLEEYANSRTPGYQYGTPAPPSMNPADVAAYTANMKSIEGGATDQAAIIKMLMGQQDALGVSQTAENKMALDFGQERMKMAGEGMRAKGSEVATQNQKDQSAMVNIREDRIIEARAASDRDQMLYKSFNTLKDMGKMTMTGQVAANQLPALATSSKPEDRAIAKELIQYAARDSSMGQLSPRELKLWTTPIPYNEVDKKTGKATSKTIVFRDEHIRLQDIIDSPMSTATEKEVAFTQLRALKTVISHAITKVLKENINTSFTRMIIDAAR